MGKWIGSRSFYKRMMQVMLPVMIQQGITSLVNLLDNIMVGKVGTEQMSGVAIANQLFFIFQLVIFGCLSGAGIFLSQYYGKNDEEKMRSVFRFKILAAALVLGLGIAALTGFGKPLIGLYLTDSGSGTSVADTLLYSYQYMRIMLVGMVPFGIASLYSSSLRETEETVIPMWAGLIAVLVNMVLNYLLIFGKLGLPKMGVAGAAWATVVSRFAELAVLLWAVGRRSGDFAYLKGAWQSLKVPGHLAVEIIKKGSPLLLNELMFSVGMAFIVQCYSTFGLDVVAAYNISSTVSNFFFLISMAMGNAIAILVGQELGAGLLEQARDTARKLLVAGLALSFCGGLIMAATSPLFPRIYNTNDAIRTTAAQLLLVEAVFLPLKGLYSNCYFTLRSGGKSFITFLFDGGFTWVVVIPLVFFLSRFSTLPLLTVFILVQAVDLIRTAMGLVLVRKGVWINNLTHI